MAIQELLKKFGKDIAYGSVIIVVVTALSAGWIKYWESRVVITAYKHKNESLEKQLKEEKSKKVKKRIVYRYIKGEISEKTVEEGVEENTKTEEDTKSKKEVKLPQCQEKMWLVGVEYGWYTKDLYGVAGICLWNTFNITVSYPFNFEVEELRLRAGITIRL